MQNSGEDTGNEVIDELRQLVVDCGLSHSTLEEVFMKVSDRALGNAATGII